MGVSVDEVADAMFEVVKDAYGKKNLKAMDLIKAMIEKYGEANCTKKLGKKAIRLLIDGGRCTYSYVGGSYVVLNPDHKG